MQTTLLKIAMVDDHTLLRKGLANLVNTFEGFEVIFEAGNGRDFIDQLETHPNPDIVLLDINMPVMNGYETAAWIRKNLPDTRVLVLSMLDNDLAIIRMLNLGARGFLVKDSHPAQFRKALTEIRDLGFCINEALSGRAGYIASNDSPENNPVQPLVSPGLSEKELHFLRLSCAELTYREIAREMGIGPRAVDSHRDALFTKLNVANRVGLVLYAIKNGIVRV
ncbi:response regulator transcription factor [Flavihumibacter fluvii]|uniref:response regulator transcription factor n=1 Tax=Flavihumibacter fluvii TaxID=2838157 RepID=UPI001BDF4E2A|nr:response regulator transcription factor [Flavihumibacter fluvii]ULQ51823.1 response regulator transcription factor [Flavihumibacter fluvii]